MQNNSSFNKDIVRLAIPIVIQNIVTTAVGSADVIMLGFVGQDALAAGSLANQIMFILNLVYAGIASGVIMLAAQYWGKNDTKTIENIMGIAMQLSVTISSVFFILAYFHKRYQTDSLRYTVLKSCKLFIPADELFTGLPLYYEKC